MPTIQAWARLMKDSVTIEPHTGVNSHGEATYGTPVVYTAHCMGKSQLVKASDGLERLSTVTSYLLGTVKISMLDRVTLPSRFVPTQPPIISVQQNSDPRGWHHTAVLT